jgi:hypothetical protein
MFLPSLVKKVVLGENLANNKTSARYFMKKDNNPK